jgi:hypothetical protein
VSLINSNDWQASQKILSDRLFEGTSLIDLSQLKELVIVPDGLLWYFPFESVQVVVGETSANLIDRVEIRYSPTLFLAYDGQRPQREAKHKALVLAKIHSRLDPLVTQNAFNDLLVAIPDILKLESLTKRIQPELLATQLDQLLVWNEVDPGRSNGLEFAPIDLPQATSTPLRLWLLLPWRTPEHIVLPAFQSDAGNNFRAKRRGTEMFMASLGMMAAGSRSMVISRWRTGGANSLVFSRNYFQRLATMPTGQAFKESLDAAREINLNYAIEPLVRTKSNDPVLKATHPFFWAQYMRFEIPLADKPEAPKELDQPDQEAIVPDENQEAVDKDKELEIKDSDGAPMEKPDALKADGKSD